MDDSSLPRSWPRPPYFALIRGPFGRAGFQVATVVRDDEPLRKIALLFSCREKAERYLAHFRPQGHIDWKVGALPDQEKLAYFLGSVKSSAPLVCVDFHRDSSSDYAFAIDEVLVELGAEG